MTGAGSLNMLKVHAGIAGSMPNSKTIINAIDGTLDIEVIGDGSEIVASTDLNNWIKKLVNNDEPSCMTSFVCTLVHNSGIMSQEDLDVLIHHKATYVRKTKQGRKQVSEYHRLGGVLENKMQSDPNYHWLCDKLYDNWLKDCVIAVKDNKPDEAEKLYNDMLDWLCDRYKVKRNKTW